VLDSDDVQVIKTEEGEDEKEDMYTDEEMIHSRKQGISIISTSSKHTKKHQGSTRYIKVLVPSDAYLSTCK
jgi:hypothetical protein